MKKRINVLFRGIIVSLTVLASIQCSIDSSRLERTEIVVSDSNRTSLYNAFKEVILADSTVNLIILEKNLTVNYNSKLGLAGTVNNPKIEIENQTFRFSITNPRLYAVDSSYIYHPKEFLNSYDKLDRIILIRYKYR